MAEKKSGKKEKTFNDLAPEFQWNPELDPEHIFEEEKKLINEVKQKLPSVQNETDKFLVAFLIARRHDLGDTIDLLKKFKKFQSEYDVQSESPPSFSNHPLLQPYRSGSPKLPLFQPSGSRDVHDRMLRYFFMGSDTPNGRDKKQVYMVMFWQLYYLLEEEPLSVWRNGIACVVDLKDFGWHNIDLSSKGREVNKNLQGTFPFRMRAFIVVNGSGVINALMTAAKLFLPKKITSRVTQYEVEQLKDVIPPKHLLTQYNGEQTIDMDEWMNHILKREESFYQRGAWKTRVYN